MPKRAIRRVRQKAKGPIDPSLGERVRALRFARGLSQSEVAGSDFSKGFISLVETGRTRVSLRAAEIIARRLGVSAGDLIGPPATAVERRLELDTLRGEQHLSAGHPQLALEAADESLPRASGPLKVQLMRLKGRALIELGRSREAIDVLDAALRSARADDRHDVFIRLLFDLARAHGRADGATEAITLALEVERRLNDRELVDRTLELQVVNFLSNMLVVTGDFVSADLRAQRALGLAEDTGDPRALADLYSGLALARQEAGDFEAALLYSHKAIDAFEQLGNARQVAASWNNLAWVYVKRGQLTRADEAANRAARLAREAKHDRLQALVLATHAEIALARGEFAESIRLAERCAEDPRASEWGRANALWVKARAVAETKPPLSKVRAAFEDAIAAFEHLPRGWRAKVRESYAGALSERDQHREAASEYQSALDLLRPGLS